MAFTLYAARARSAAFFLFVVILYAPAPFASAVIVAFAAAVFGAAKTNLSTRMISPSFAFLESTERSAPIRIFLFIFPSANLNIGNYNIHHLYIGAFLIIIALTFFILGIVNKYIIIFAGISSALVLDQIVYLIATNGSDASYLTLVSLIGAFILSAIVILFAFILHNINKNKVRA